MKQDEKFEGNKLIAEFMGWQLVTVGYFGGEEETQWQRDNSDWMDEVNMDDVGDYFVNVPENKWLYADVSYHTSWDWLMPVVEKIETLGYQFKQCSKRVEIWKDDNKPHKTPIIDNKEETKILSAWYAVVEFIKWHNENTLQK